MENTIYCLFSIANEYDQPKNNLVCAWLTRPSHEQLKSCFTGSVTDVEINNMRKKGREQRIYGDDYRLERVEIGKKL